MAPSVMNTAWQCHKLPWPETNAEYPVLEQEGEVGGSMHSSTIVSLGRSPERSPVLARTGFGGGS